MWNNVVDGVWSENEQIWRVFEREKERKREMKVGEIFLLHEVFSVYTRDENLSLRCHEEYSTNHLLICLIFFCVCLISLLFGCCLSLLYIMILSLFLFVLFFFLF